MSGWRAHHLYYHGDRDLLLREVVLPLAQDWLASGRVEQIFFVRYPLGGDHVRLRFLPAAESAAAGLRGELEQRAERFFAFHPSADGKTPEQLEADAAAIRATDPNEQSFEVFPNNSCREMEFRPETERYGGPAALPASLELFTVSSLRVLAMLGALENASRGKRLTEAIALLVEQGAAFARSREELADLMGYGLAWAGGDLESPLVAKADRVFESQGETLSRGLAEVASAAAGPSRTALAAGFGELRERLEAAGLDNRRLLEIGKSQLHMTANRLGLINAEEIYVSRLASRACTGFPESSAEGEREPEPGGAVRGAVAELLADRLQFASSDP